MKIRTDFENDDIKYALEYNNPTTFNYGDISGLVAEVVGANDELHWWWIVQLKGFMLKRKKYVLLSAWCDYTGWDCQSGITEEMLFNNVMDCVNSAPEQESNSGRNIKNNLLLQVQGDIAFGLYDSKYELGRKDE